MRKTELLAPAGDFTMLKYAIHNGADAVYISGNNYGARKYAKNFTNDEIVEAIKYSHLYGVKVYITVNTLIKDNEINDFMKYIDFIHKNNVDAVLMQDLGMINLVRNTYPNLEIHASTQFHNHNKEDLEFLHKIGVKRAVLARELNIDEIKEMNVDIEKEIFVHGALCIAYSGECLMSSMILDRSGNRGCCAGMCRLPYTLLKNGKIESTNGKYLLSSKELCTIEHLKEILDLNIDSIKIEGRMKSPQYVGYVTKIYRKYIDNYYNNKNMDISKDEIDNLKVLYNRGFTTGFLINKTKNITNQLSPNHIGIKIGKVVNTTKKKIKIKLTRQLNQEDAIKFKDSNLGMYVNFIYDENGKLIKSANKDQIVILDNKINLSNNDVVLKTIDTNLINEINNYKEKRIPIVISVRARENSKIFIEFNDGKNKVFKAGSLLEKAINQSLTKEMIEEKLTKLGNTIYECKKINIEVDNNLFIPIKELNELRRELVEKLNNIRIEPKIKYKKNLHKFKTLNINLTNTLNILIDNEKDYLELYKYNNINFYTEKKELYLKYKKNNNIYLRLNRVLKSNLDYKNDRIILNDSGYINKLIKNNELITDIYSNVTNSYTVRYLHELGIKKVGLSPELKLEEVNELYKSFIDNFNYEPNLELFIYGKVELMLLKHCILNTNLNKNIYCDICKKNKYELLDRNNKRYTLKQNNCITTILDSNIIDYTELLNNIKINNYLISFIDINEKEKNRIKRIIKDGDNDKICNS